MDWKVTGVTTAPNGMDRVRVHHHDSVVKVQKPFGQVAGE